MRRLVVVLHFDVSIKVLTSAYRARSIVQQGRRHAHPASYFPHQAAQLRSAASERVLQDGVSERMPGKEDAARAPPAHSHGGRSCAVTLLPYR